MLPEVSIFKINSTLFVLKTLLLQMSNSVSDVEGQTEKLAFQAQAPVDQDTLCGTVLSWCIYIYYLIFRESKELVYCFHEILKALDSGFNL